MSKFQENYKGKRHSTRIFKHIFLVIIEYQPYEWLLKTVASLFSLYPKTDNQQIR